MACGLGASEILLPHLAEVQIERVERGDTRALYDDPQHPYTRQLLDAVPIPDPVVQRLRRAQRRSVVAEGDELTATHQPSAVR